MAQKLENPLPHLMVVKDAARKLVSIRRDLFLLDTELKTLRQIRRLAFGIAALVFANAALIVSAYWVTEILYEFGWTPRALATVSFFSLGLVSALLGWIGIRVGRAPSREPAPGNATENATRSTNETIQQNRRG